MLSSKNIGIEVIFLKQYVSVFMLHVKSIWYRLLLLFLAMAVGESFLFFRQLQRVLPAGSSHQEQIRAALALVIEDSHISLVFLAGLALTAILLCLHGYEWNTKSSYTIQRLSLPGWNYFLLQGFFSSLVFLVLFFFQIALILCLCFGYFKQMPEQYYSNQTLFTTFYRSHFLYSLLPLADGFRQITNLIMMAALGFASAYFSYCSRLGEKYGPIPVYLFVCLLSFQSSFGSYVYLILLTSSLLCLFWILISSYGKEARL